MKIAIPLWNDRISPVFDTATRLLVVEVAGQEESSRFETILDEEDLARRCLRINRLGVDVLICGAISRPYSRILSASGINIIPQISGLVEDVLRAYFKGELSHPRFLMPGCISDRVRRHKKGMHCKKLGRPGGKRKTGNS
jgi:predicted Fe-Mo cluster-binding NifX family protein